MIRSLGKIDKVYQWMAFHGILGVLSSLSKWFIIAWFLSVAIQSYARILKTRDRTSEAMYLMAYIFGMEILFRMVGTSPFIPYEVGKYGPMFIIITTLIIARQRSQTVLGFIIMSLVFPSMLIYNGEKYFDDIAFNFFGMMTLGLTVQYFHGRIITRAEFINLTRTFLMPVISILAYLVIKTPSIQDIEFKLGASFETTAGFGSNQVSTIFGVAAFLLAVAYFNRYVIFGRRTIDLILLAFILARALLTFSRGGVVVSALVIIIYLLMMRPAGYSLPGFKAGQMIMFLAIIVTSAVVVNKLTGNALLLRYEGETQTTLTGEKEKDINVLTTGRYELFVSELELFIEYPILGVGPGGAMYLRSEGERRVASHSEFSRLLAENGIFGLMLIFILITYPLTRYFKIAKDPGKILAFCLALLAIGMTFHAAMRTFVTPFLFGLGAASIYLNKE